MFEFVCNATMLSRKRFSIWFKMNTCHHSCRKCFFLKDSVIWQKSGFRCCLKHSEARFPLHSYFVHCWIHWGTDSERKRQKHDVSTCNEVNEIMKTWSQSVSAIRETLNQDNDRSKWQRHCQIRFHTELNCMWMATLHFALSVLLAPQVLRGCFSLVL